MNDELRAAAERYRSKAYAESMDDMDECFRDRALLADAYLASVPPDDETPIDEAWLRACGLYGPYEHRPNDEVSIEAIYGGGYLSWSPMRGARLCDLHLGFTTRGEIRRLCSALGSELKEPKS